MYPLLKPLQNPSLCVCTPPPDIDIYYRTQICLLLVQLWMQKVFSNFEKVLEFHLDIGWTPQLLCAGTAKQKATATLTETASARCWKQCCSTRHTAQSWSPPYRISFLPPPALLPPSSCLRPTLPPFSTLSSLLPFEPFGGCMEVSVSFGAG